MTTERAAPEGSSYSGFGGLSLANLILELRPDLRERIRLGKAPNQLGFLGWLVTNGIKEFAALRDDKSFLQLVTGREEGDPLTRLQRLTWMARRDVQAAFPLPGALERFRVWFYTHAVEEQGLWPFLSDDERMRLRQRDPWKTRYAADEPPEAVSFDQRSFGVNVIGYAYGQLGIGEDARMAGLSLRAAGVPFTMLDFRPGPTVPQGDKSMADYVSADAPYAFNLFCMTAMETGRFYAKTGAAQFEGRYNIGYWPWELGRWPEAWVTMTRLVNEVWVSTRHIYDALSPVSPVPVLVMPMAVSLGPVARRTRAEFGLPEDAVLFVFSFDLNSYLHRKNPEACLAAFTRAFPRTGKQGRNGRQVGLVIKTHAPAKPDAGWDRLKNAARRDNRIHIIEGTLDRPDLLALYGLCDCFLSLHRAEGFGRGIAEALQLGLEVIATGYSGNLDFCRPGEVALVDYKLVPVREGQYPYGAGQVWAEPDLKHAAELMRRLVADRAKKRSAVSVKRKNWPEFAPEVVGARYLERLRLISNLKAAHKHDLLQPERAAARRRKSSRPATQTSRRAG